jgi:DNA invertase Pin-like site-specific DNA recombinase
MTTALIYIRQSRHKADQRTVSPEVQEQACRALPAVRACTEIIIYRDLDISGGKPPEQRPAFMALHERVRASDRMREPIVVATYNQSRLSRNNADSAAFYAFIENRLWVNLVMVDGHFDRSPSGELTWAVMAAAATHLRKSTAKNIRDAYAKLNADGKATGMPPYGLRWKGDRTGWEHDPERAEVVRHIFELYANTGNSAKVIAAVLNREHHAVPTRAGEWMPDTVVDLLHNPAYAGLKYKTRQARRARHTSELIKAAWEPMIDRPTWDRVQRLMARKQPPVRKGEEPREYWFQGLLWCRSCGQPMRATTNHGIAYYQCRRDVSDPCSSGSRSIHEERLRPWADHLFTTMAGLAPADFAEVIHAAKNDDRVQAVDAIRDIEQQQRRVARRYEMGHIDDAAYKERWEELERLKEQWQVAPTHGTKPRLPIANLAAGWSRATPRQRRDLLALLFEKLWIRRAHDTKWDAEHGQELDVIDTYVPRSDYPMEVVGLVSALVGAEGQVSIEVPALRTTGQHAVARSGKGGIRTLEGALHPLPA